MHPFHCWIDGDSLTYLRGFRKLNDDERIVKVAVAHPVIESKSNVVVRRLEPGVRWQPCPMILVPAGDEVDAGLELRRKVCAFMSPASADTNECRGVADNRLFDSGVEVDDGVADRSARNRQLEGLDT